MNWLVPDCTALGSTRPESGAHRWPDAATSDRAGGLVTFLTNKIPYLVGGHRHLGSSLHFGARVGGDSDRLSAEWWQHSVSIPSPQNPILDETGTNCGIGQRGNMWLVFSVDGKDRSKLIKRRVASDPLFP